MKESTVKSATFAFVTNLYVLNIWVLICELLGYTFGNNFDICECAPKTTNTVPLLSFDVTKRCHFKQESCAVRDTLSISRRNQNPIRLMNTRDAVAINLLQKTLQPRTMARLLLVLFVLFFTCLPYAHATELHCALEGAEDYSANTIRLDAYARNGALVATVPVRPDGTSRLPSLSDGVYALSVVGSTAWAYTPIHLHVSRGGTKLAVELRTDPLALPGRRVEQVTVNETHPLVLRTLGRAVHIPQAEQWSIYAILGNRFYMFQLFAVGFVVLFPRYLKTLDRETIAELTGEVEPEQVDPNLAIKALYGLGENGGDEVAPTITASSL